MGNPHQNGDRNALSRDPLLPRLLHVHVESVAAVQVPHLGEPIREREGKRNSKSKHGLEKEIDVRKGKTFGKFAWVSLASHKDEFKGFSPLFLLQSHLRETAVSLSSSRLLLPFEMQTHSDSTF